MFNNPFRKLTGTVAAAATALALMTAAAVPAHAEINDTARVLGGAAAIALGAKIIHDNRKEKREQERRESEWNNRWNDRDRDHDRGRHRGHDRDRDRGERQARLPERCISDYDRRRGQVIAVYDENCLRRHARR